MKATLRHFLTPPPPSSSLGGRVNLAGLEGVEMPDGVDLSDSTSITTSSTTGVGGSLPSTPTTANAASGTASSAAAGFVGVAPKTKILEVHPSLPYVAYVTGGDHFDKHPELQRIVVQDYIRNSTLRAVTIPELCESLSLGGGNTPTSARRHAGHAIAAKTLGSVRSIGFMDRHTLFWSTGGAVRRGGGDYHRESGEHPNECLHAASSVPPSLIVEFDSRIVLLNLKASPGAPSGSANGRSSTPRSKSKSSLANTTSSRRRALDPYRPIFTSITRADLGSPYATSTALPVTPEILAIGCSDGTVRFFSITEKKVIKSVRGPNGKNDPVIRLTGTNRYPNHGPLEEEDSRAAATANTGEDVIKMKIVSTCSSGLVFLWEFTFSIDVRTGKTTYFGVRPPIARMDGYGEKKVESASAVGGVGVVGSSSSYFSAANTFTHYDPERDFLLLSVPSGYNGSSKCHIVAWDLGSLPNQPAASVSGPSSIYQNVPKHEPFLVMQVHPSVIASAGSGSGSSNNDASFLPGLMHPTFPDAALTCLVGTKNGDLTMVAAALDNAETTKQGDKTVRTTTYYQCSLSSLRHSLERKALGKIRVYSISSSRFRPTSIVIGTNLGVMVIDLDQDGVFVPGTRHARLSRAGGVLLIENSSVFTATLDSTSSSNSVVGHIGVKSPTLVYKSPPALHLPPEIQSRPVRLPPKILPSPSGTFLCLFWQEEQRYEILHMESLTTPKPRERSATYTPAVDTGSNVLSFAWVGDGNVFALLHPPEYVKTKEGGGTGGGVASSSVVSPVGSTSGGGGGGGTKKLGKSIKKAFFSAPGQSSLSGGPASSTSMMGEDEDVTPIRDPAKFSPRVELKVLIGVNAEAAEISGSIAAATATLLGDMTLRGGLQNPPTVLFGGPVLCVGSLQRDGDASNGMAYFYSKKESAADDYNHASVFVSVGPPLPYPDLVVWDDDGRLCAIIVGNRIAIYLSDQPNFTLLGTVLLGSPTEAEPTVQSAKFIHRVLYCSTRTAVQCVFLGELDTGEDGEGEGREAGVCEVDSFVLASADVPAPGLASRTIGITVNNSIAPVPIPMALLQPSILSYHGGSLLVSTTSGIQSIPLVNPLLRIGILLAAGQHARAQRWFEAVPEESHEALARFLERRGAPDLAANLPGLSLETIVDLSLRYGLTERLEVAIETHGLDAMQMIDMGRGLSGNGGHSVVVCVGAYLLGQGKAELVRRLATECMVLGEVGRREAFVLAGLLLAVDAPDARRLVKRAVKPPGGATTEADNPPSRWPVGEYVRDHVL